MLSLHNMHYQLTHAPRTASPLTLAHMMKSNILAVTYSLMTRNP